MSRGLLLILWGWMVIWSVLSGRLDLLLRGVFHSLVGVSGVVLVAAGILLVIRHRRRREGHALALADQRSTGLSGVGDPPETLLQ